MDKIENMKMNSELFQQAMHSPLLRIAIGVIFVNIPAFFFRSIAQLVLSSLSVKNDAVQSLVVFVVRLLTVYFFYTLFVKTFEKRKAEELSIDLPAIKEFFVGGTTGFILIVMVMGIMHLLGNFFISGINKSPTIFQSFLYHFFFAFVQDVVFFLIVFRIIEKSLGSWTTVAIASVVFGFQHLLFPGYTVWSAIAQAFEAGILFSAFFIMTRRIWLLFGFHFVWNFIEYGIILGFKPGGLTALFIPDFTGSRLITGVPIGPEASIITFIMGTVLGLVILLKARKKGRFILPSLKIKKQPSI